MGMAAALFALGAGTLIAGVGLLPDTPATRRFSQALHRNLREGDPPAVALARLQAEPASRLEDYLTSASFVCFGAG